ncbi:MAG: gas vesicle protein GvpC, partial [Cyanobacteriota bacterium]
PLSMDMSTASDVGTASVETPETPIPSPSIPVPAPEPQPPIAAVMPAIPVISPTPVAETEEPNRILTYVNEYVEALRAQNPDLTLLQVIGNREQVRDLLARGAVDLGVDPSEILTTLRRMVSETVAV